MRWCCIIAYNLLTIRHWHAGLRNSRHSIYVVEILYLPTSKIIAYMERNRVRPVHGSATFPFYFCFKDCKIREDLVSINGMQPFVLYRRIANWSRSAIYTLGWFSHGRHRVAIEQVAGETAQRAECFDVSPGNCSKVVCTPARTTPTRGASTCRLLSEYVRPLNSTAIVCNYRVMTFIDRPDSSGITCSFDRTHSLASIVVYL